MNLKYYREKKNMTQDELAVIADVSRQTISKIENNEESTISNITMKKLANALNVTVDKLFFKTLV